MVILRATQKLRGLLPPTTNAVAESDTALGDWYVNRIVVDRRPLLLMVSARGLLPILIPARDVRELPGRLGQLVATCLRQHRVADRLITAETAAMSPVAVAPTRDRSVVGIMVDFAHAVPFHLEAGAWNDATLPFVALQLAETPCHTSRPFDQVVFPVKAVPSLLQQKWGAG